MTWKCFKFIDLFAGIGGLRIPFNNYNGDCVFSSEIDEACQVSYAANFGEKPCGDITKIAPKLIPDHDILLVGFLLYKIYQLLKGGAAMSIFIGIVAIYVLWWLFVKILDMQLLGALLGQFMSVGVLALIIVFQQ